MNLSQDEPTYLPLDKKQVENIPLIGTHLKKKVKSKLPNVFITLHKNGKQLIIQKADSVA